MQIVPGETQTIRLRGLKLKDVTEVQTTPAVSLIVKEKKDATVPNGLEAKDVGDQELIAEVNIPLGCTATTLLLTAVSPAGSSEARTILLDPKESTMNEKEPNNGFSDAQLIDCAKPIDGRVDPDKDVDVFRVDAHSGKTVNLRVTAAVAGSLLDSTLSVFDHAGRLLASADDSDGSRDARATVTPVADGPLLIVVGDAHDRGGAWHGYRLQVEAQR
jgi:hypothetical protein